MRRTKKNVLIIFANPRETDPLPLGAEERAVKESIRLSQFRAVPRPSGSLCPQMGRGLALLPSL